MGRTNHARNAFLAALIAVVSLALVIPPAHAAEPTFTPVKRYKVVRRLVFPVVGATKYWSGFGDCRDNCTREHHGIDILTYGWKGLPVVAAHDGTITKVTYDSGNAGCSVHIRSEDGWETRYLHLNNDIPRTDDIGYPCPAPGIEVGTPVAAGQLIAWVGDSGNAETTDPHVHFELRNRSGYPIDPYPSLRRAGRVTHEWLPTDASSASIALAQANHEDSAETTFVVLSDDVHALERSEIGAMILQAPVIVIDPANRQPALEEISRLESNRVVLFTDDDVPWLTRVLTRPGRILETMPLPAEQIRETSKESDEGHASIPELAEAEHDPLTPEPNIRDDFATIIAGSVDAIREDYQDAYAAFTIDHRSLVLVDSESAQRYVGQGIATSPGRYADRDLLWWLTGDGWIGTSALGDVPDRGFAYVTEANATPWTLAFLGSLAETPTVPVWREGR